MGEIDAEVMFDTDDAPDTDDASETVGHAEVLLRWNA